MAAAVLSAPSCAVGAAVEGTWVRVSAQYPAQRAGRQWSGHSAEHEAMRNRRMRATYRTCGSIQLRGPYGGVDSCGGSVLEQGGHVAASSAVSRQGPTRQSHQLRVQQPVRPRHDRSSRRHSGERGQALHLVQAVATALPAHQPPRLGQLGQSDVERLPGLVLDSRRS